MYNNGFPVGYPFQPQPQTQSMTLPTIHADIIQIPSEQDAWNQPVDTGGSKMMMTRDESAIIIKRVYPNSQPTMDIYRREAQSLIPSPSDYVTKEELNEILKGLKTPQKAKKEVADESV
jgi:hypothetical protein